MRRRRGGCGSAWTAVSRRRAGRRVPGIERLLERLVVVMNPKPCSGAVRCAAHADTPVAAKKPDRCIRVLFLRAASAERHWTESPAGGRLR
jgi:hypothetical protein